MGSRALACVAVWLAACATAPPPPPPPPGVPAQLIDVYLLPVGDFSYELTEQLARMLASDTGLVVRASLPMGAGELAPLEGDQFAAEDIIARAQEVGSRLPVRSPDSIVIALTGLDINERGRTLRFVFASANPAAHTSVLSVARLGFSTPKAPATREQVFARIFKMTKRMIGEQYFHLERSSDLGNVMYAPIMSLEDVDAMGADFPRNAVPKGEMALAPPPPGYSWRKVPAIAAAILVPDGWYWREEKNGKTYSVFVTKEEIGDGSFETGVTLNAFLWNPAAPDQVANILRGLATQHSANISVRKHASFAAASCEFDLPRKDGGEPVHVFYLAIVNRRTRTSYLAIFEAPASQWAEAWRHGLAILDGLALADQL